MADAKPRPPVPVRSVNCPNCGAATAVRTFGHAVNVVCQNCQSIVDAQHAGVDILQRYQKAIRYDPLIPLGTRGKLPGSDVSCCWRVQTAYKVEPGLSSQRNTTFMRSDFRLKSGFV